jgi:hypothetical protein
MKQKQAKETKIIAGCKVTLTVGERYFAGRPFAHRSRKVYPVSIREIDTGAVVKTVSGLTYDQANEFLTAFNNDRRGSLYGRKW